LDLLVLFAMILGGTAAVVWFATSPAEVRHAVVNHSANFAVLGLGQPGVLLSVWILMKSKRPLAMRIMMALATICVLSVIAPMWIVSFISRQIT